MNANLLAAKAKLLTGLDTAAFLLRSQPAGSECFIHTMKALSISNIVEGIHNLLLLGLQYKYVFEVPEGPRHAILMSEREAALADIKGLVLEAFLALKSIGFPKNLMVAMEENYSRL